MNETPNYNNLVQNDNMTPQERNVPEPWHAPNEAEIKERREPTKIHIEVNQEKVSRGDAAFAIFVCLSLIIPGIFMLLPQAFEIQPMTNELIIHWDMVGWCLLWFGLPTFIMVFVLTRRNTREEEYVEKIAKNTIVKCPKCGNDFVNDAGYCPYCQTRYSNEDIMAIVSSKHSNESKR